jgi:dynein heavy chain
MKSSTLQAKDNARYLFTLEKFIDVLYTGKPPNIIDTLPALMNSIKMIHSIARYFNTREKMTDLFLKITHAIIANCRAYIVDVDHEETGENLWRKNSNVLVARLEECLQVNEVYQETYRLTREKLTAQPANRQFDFEENVIFGRLDAFCRRLIKLIDLFTTIQQYRALEMHQVEGLSPLIKDFDGLVAGLGARRHNMLAYQMTDFDRDYVEFNASVDALEQKLQTFINISFNTVKSVESSLALLAKFESVLRRESLTAELQAKATTIFFAFSHELELTQAIYEDQKQRPPTPRNLPPVAGNIAWSRNLLSRIEAPMHVFQTRYAHVFNAKGAKPVVKLYNKVARTLVAYEILWFNAWVESLPQAVAGLQACLLIRHPSDDKMYVNFDVELLQVIRESKCLNRMGFVIPPDARVVALQEDRFKRHFTELGFMLKELTRVFDSIIPVTEPLLQPAIADLEAKMRPGMVSLTWTSMNIDLYRAHVSSSLRQFEDLIRGVNDVIENRM